MMVMIRLFPSGDGRSNVYKSSPPDADPAVLQFTHLVMREENFTFLVLHTKGSHCERDFHSLYSCFNRLS